MQQAAMDITQFNFGKKYADCQILLIFKVK